MNSHVIKTSAIILASMWIIHRVKGEHLAMTDFAGIAAGTAVAYYVRSICVPDLTSVSGHLTDR